MRGNLILILIVSKLIDCNFIDVQATPPNILTDCGTNISGKIDSLLKAEYKDVYTKQRDKIKIFYKIKFNKNKNIDSIKIYKNNFLELNTEKLEFYLKNMDQACIIRNYSYSPYYRYIIIFSPTTLDRRKKILEEYKDK